jgi:signal transduction histidine kinase
LGRFLGSILFLFLSTLGLYSQQYLESISNNYCWFHFAQSENDFWLGSEKGWSHHKNGDVRHFNMGDTLSGLKGTYIQSNLFHGGKHQLFAASYTHINQYDEIKDRFSSFQIKKNKTEYYRTDYHILDIDTINRHMYAKVEMDIIIYNYDTRSIVEKIDTNNLSIRFGLSPDRQKIVGVRWTHGLGIDTYEKKNGTWIKTEHPTAKALNNSDQKVEGRNVIIDKDHAYISTNLGIVSLNLLTHETKNIEIPGYRGYVFHIDKYKDNFIWSGVQGKIGIYNYRTKIVSYPPELQEFNQNVEYSHFLFHTERSLFVGYDVGGFYKYDLESTISSGFKKHDFSEIHEIRNHDGSIIILKKNMLSKYDGSKILKRVVVPLYSEEQKIRCEFNIYDGKIYIMNEENLHIYDSNLNLLSNLKHNINDRITNMVISEGNILLTTAQFYYYINLSSLKGISKGKINFIKNTEKFISHGISLSKKISSAQNGDLFSNGKIIGNIGYLNHVNNFEPTTYILSTKRGLYKLKDSNLEVLKLSSFNENNIIYGTDAKGDDLWVTSSEGLFYFNLKSHVSIRIPRFNSLQLDDHPPVIVGDKIYVLASGNLYSINSDISFYNNVPKINLKNVNVDGAFTSNQNIIKASYDFNSLSLHLIPGEIGEQYYFRNIQFDSLFKKVENNTITFQGLKPGDYQIEILNVGANNLQSEKYIQQIIVNKPFWQRLDFILATLLSIFGLSYFINYRISKAKLEKEKLKLEKVLAINEQRMVISRDLHDEIGSGLTAIKYLTASGTTTEDMPKTIHDLSANLIDNMRDMLWSLDEDNDTSESLVARIRISAQQFFKNTGIRFIINQEIKEGIVITGKLRKAIILLSKEAFTNIIKHSKATLVNIEIEINEAGIKLGISDNGIGIIAHESDNKNYGLESMKNRVANINGTFQLQSSSEGTSIEVRVPLS